jgi:hypothetical protein
MKVSFSFFFCLISLTAISQSDSIFYEVPLFFEDAIGNKDTVYLGLSEFANPEFNPSLGEVNLINVPFDSVFEVRLAIFNELAGGDSPSYLGKKHVLPIQFAESNPTTCDGLTIHDHASFVVNSVHPPLTISWDSSPFREGGDLRCLGGSWINNTHAPLTFFGWENLHLFNDAFSFGCMADWDEEVTIIPSNLIPLEGDSVPRGYGSNPFQDYTVLTVEGSTQLAGDTMLIYNLWWASTRGDLCSDLVPTENIVITEAPISVYPNPTSGSLTIESTFSVEPKTIKVFSTTGSLIRTFSGESGTIDASDLPSGLYLLKAVFNDGRSGTTKFVKH